MRTIQIVLALVAILFGLATLVAGALVLAGTDPGYVVYRPLVIYNTAMGLGYIGAGVIACRSVQWGRHAAAIIFVMNLLVLAAVGYLYAIGSAVAIDSVGAMIMRTGVWLVLLLALAWLALRSREWGGSAR